jgi:hypothetical protein
VKRADFVILEFKILEFQEQFKEQFQEQFQESIPGNND